MAHAPAVTDVQTDVHIVPVDCDRLQRNLLKLPTPDVALVLSQGNLTSPGHHSLHQFMCNTLICRHCAMLARICDSQKWLSGFSQ